MVQSMHLHIVLVIIEIMQVLYVMDNETCTIDNNLEQRPLFRIGKQANCEFTGQSINVDYSCVPGKFKYET